MVESPVMYKSLVLRVLLAFLLLSLSQISLQTQNRKPAESGTILVNPTPQQKRDRPGILMTRNGFGSIKAAVNSISTGPAEIYLTCGTYVENIVITTSEIKIVGEERACVQIEPADPTLPVISIDATGTGIPGMHADEVSDLTILCPTGTTCNDGLKITGRTDINQPNDFHKFSRLAVYGSFQNGVNLAGRTIWTEFDNMEVEYALQNGVNIASSGVTNALTFRNVRSAKNLGYGFYLNNTQVDRAQGILFDTVNAEYNGQNTSLPECAGLYMTGVIQANIQNSYFEGNCQGNTADNRAAEVRITGTYANSVNIIDTAFNLQYGEGGIYNDAVLTTGHYEGNKFDTSTGNFTMYIATSHPSSNIVIGANFNTNPMIVPDGNGFTHVRMLSPFGFDYAPVTSVSGNSIDVSAINGLILYYGPYTINSFANGHVGQLLYVTAVNAGGHVLTSGAGGPGQIIFPDGLNGTLNIGESLMLFYDGNAWRPIERAISGQSRYIASITTTATPSDTATVPGLTASAHCLFSPRNSPASIILGTYVTTGDGTVTLHHTPLAGAVFDVFCSSQ
jgi:hypothetical protein